MASYLLTPFGSGGDVNPFIWLGRLLQARGHEVTLMTVPMFREHAERAGLDFVGVGDEAAFMAFLDHPDLWKPLRGTAAVFDLAAKSVEPFYRAILEHLDKHPSIIASPFHNVAARMAREKTGARLVTVHLQPSCFLSAHDMPVFVNGAAWMKKLPLWCRRLLFALPNPMSFHLARLLRPLCKTEDITMPRRMLPDWMHSPDANLALFPDWFAAPQPDWPENVIQAGFPLEDLSGQFVLPSDVDEFLAQGDKPVLLSPGTGNSQAREFFKAGLAACERLGCRALLGTKFKEQLPSPLPSWARHFEYLPFSELLPRVSVLVHHGGIGTMSQALAAGVPQLVMPMAHDQPDNADRVKRLGAGEWLAPSKFNKERVAEQLRDLMTNNKVAAACAMSAQCCHESRATELAMKLLESM